MNKQKYSFDIESEENDDETRWNAVEWKDYFGALPSCDWFFDPWLWWGGIWLWPKFRLSVISDWWSPLYFAWIACDARCSSICQAGGLGLDGDQYLALYSQYA